MPCILGTRRVLFSLTVEVQLTGRTQVKRAKGFWAGLPKNPDVSGGA